jgi:hypothetical protein
MTAPSLPDLPLPHSGNGGGPGSGGGNEGAAGPARGGGPDMDLWALTDD